MFWGFPPALWRTPYTEFPRYCNSKKQLKITSYLVHSTPYTLHSTYLVHSTPYTLHSTYPVHSTPYTLHSTLQRIPYTLRYSKKRLNMTSYLVQSTLYIAAYPPLALPCTPYSVFPRSQQKISRNHICSEKLFLFVFRLKEKRFLFQFLCLFICFCSRSGVRPNPLFECVCVLCVFFCWYAPMHFLFVCCDVFY